METMTQQQIITAEKIKNMSVANIANVIQKDWGAKVYFGAKPHLKAMHTLNTVNEMYGCDTGKSIVAYFLSNASTYRGETAKIVKAELNKRIKQ